MGCTIPTKTRVKGGKKRKKKRKPGEPKRQKGAASRIMIASLKMRFFRTRGGGEEAEAIDEMRVANVHMNNRTAKKNLQEGGTCYKTFWDKLAGILAEWCPSIMCGDFNMSLFSVIPELRARGFQINMAAWYCWKHPYEKGPRADSCGIFILGPCHGVRMCYDPSVFGLLPPELPDNCSMMMEILRDDDGNEIDRRRWDVPTISIMGQGEPLAHY